jgi:hypothetical protein
MKMIILPRQARDKHRERDHSTKEYFRFLATPSVNASGKETPLFAMPFIYQMHDFTKTGSGQT